MLMHSSSPDVSVCILTKNAGPRFLEVLASLEKQHIVIPWELLVIDSGSIDGTPDHVARYAARVHAIHPSEFGHGRTRNLAARLARGKLLVGLSQDATPVGPHWLEHMLAPFADPQVGAVFCRQEPRSDSSPMEEYFLRSWYPAHGGWRVVSHDSPTLTGAMLFSNAAAAYRRIAWEQKPFCETLVMSEDQQFARDLLAEGWRIVYVPEVSVLHSHHYTLSTAFRRNFDSGASLRTITTDRTSDWFGHGLFFLVREVRHVGRRAGPLAAGFTVLYEFVRFAGFAAGRHHLWFPKWLKPHLGLHRSWWIAQG
jgi:rhamnosyltransferase